MPMLPETYLRSGMQPAITMSMKVMAGMAVVMADVIIDRYGCDGMSGFIRVAFGGAILICCII